MNKYWRVGLSVLLVISLWGALLFGFASYRVRMSGVVPTFPYYQLLTSQASPELAVWGHFDGAHYLKLASAGYIDNGTQAFFPVYPLLISAIHTTGLSYFASAVLLSFISLVLALICLHLLFRNSAWTIIAILLVFPTSFFLGAIYTESLFLLLTIFFFLLLKRKQYLFAAIIAGVASGTRLVGALLALSLLIELWPQLKTKKYYLLLIPLALSGLLGYMYFLNNRFGDPLAFIHVQSMFGANRSGGEIILLPQVIFRYLKILVTVSPLSILFQRAFLEFIIFGIFAFMTLKNRKRVPLSWNIYLLGSLIIPTLSGTLSSFPRYAIVLIPWLIPEGFRFKLSHSPLIIISIALLFLLLSLFSLGQFVS